MKNTQDGIPVKEWSKDDPGRESGIAVYYAITDELKNWYPRCLELVTVEERETAGRFLFESDRCTYVLCHALIRVFLAEQIKKEPLEIVFVRDGHDKPFLNDGFIQFNISHTRDAFMFAFSASSVIGVDVENVRRGMEYDGIIDSFFTPQEKAFIRSDTILPEERFYLLWTRKEALLKAKGCGITGELKSVDVTPMFSVQCEEDFSSVTSPSYHNGFFLRSYKLQDHFLSLATKCNTEPDIFYLTDQSLYSIFKRS